MNPINEFHNRKLNNELAAMALLINYNNSMNETKWIMNEMNYEFSWMKAICRLVSFGIIPAFIHQFIKQECFGAMNCLMNWINEWCRNWLAELKRSWLAFRSIDSFFLEIHALILQLKLLNKSFDGELSNEWKKWINGGISKP